MGPWSKNSRFNGPFGLCVAVVIAGLWTNVTLAQKNRWTSKVRPDETVVYKVVGDVELKMEIFKPSVEAGDDRRPALVLFFGGGWVGGSTQQFHKQARYFASRGMTVFVADYRVASRHGTTPKECVKDGKSAIRWVRSHAAKWQIDPAKIAAGGGSAGGHVASAAAMVTSFDEPGENLSVSCRPDALVLFNPVFDNGPEGYGYDRVQKYWREISPLHQLSETSPPTIVFLGTEDKLIPVKTAETYRDKMRELGRTCELHLYPGGTHGFFNSGEFFEDTVKKADRFLTKLGYLKGEAGDTSIEAIEKLGPSE